MLASEAKINSTTCQSHQHGGSRQRQAGRARAAPRGRSHPAALHSPGQIRPGTTPGCGRWEWDGERSGGCARLAQPGHTARAGSRVPGEKGRKGGQNPALASPAHSPAPLRAHQALCRQHNQPHGPSVTPGGAFTRTAIPVNYYLARHLHFHTGSASSSSRDEHPSGTHTAGPADPARPHSLPVSTDTPLAPSRKAQRLPPRGAGAGRLRWVWARYFQPLCQQKLTSAAAGPFLKHSHLLLFSFKPMPTCRRDKAPAGERRAGFHPGSAKPNTRPCWQSRSQLADQRSCKPKGSSQGIRTAQLHACHRTSPTSEVPTGFCAFTGEYLENQQSKETQKIILYH